MKLFILKDGELSLYKDEVLLYPPLRKLVTRDRGSVGDADGRKKLQAWKEFAYLYYVCDYSGYPKQNGLNEKETHAFAIKNAELPEDWMPDEDVREAMDFYHDHHMTVTREINNELVCSFHNSAKVIKKIRQQSEILLDKALLTPSEVTQLTDIQTTLLAIATKLPAQFKALKESNQMIKEEEREGEVGRGGFEVEDSMDPDRTLKGD